MRGSVSSTARCECREEDDQEPGRQDRCPNLRLSLRHGREAIQERDYAKARKYLEVARRQAEEAPLGPQYQAHSLGSLAALLYTTGKYNRAEALARHATHLAQAAGETGALAQSIALDCLGQLAGFIRGQYDEAESCYREALALRVGVLGRADPSVAAILFHLGRLHILQARQAEAAVLLERAHRILEATPGIEPLLLVESLRDLASLYVARGQEAAAEPLLQRALNLAEQRLNPQDSRLVLILCPLSSLYCHLARYEEAMPLLLRTFDIVRKTRHRASGELLPCLDNLATVFLRAGQYGWAKRIWKGSLAIIRRSHGRGNRNWAHTLMSLALVYHREGKTDGPRSFIGKLWPGCAERWGRPSRGRRGAGYPTAPGSRHPTSRSG